MSELASPPAGAATPESIPPRIPDREATPVPSEQPRSAAGPARPGDRPSKPPSGIVAGALLAQRYRLRNRVGSDAAAAAEFWRAEDTILQRDVAITVLRGPGPDAGLDSSVDPTPEDPTGAARAGEMVARAMRSGSFEHTGCARLLDVLGAGAPGLAADVLGAAVTEWVPGRSLAEAVADGLIKPLAAARAVSPLAAAAEAAHRRGLVLGCDQPQRIRITADGRAQLCFALPRPDVTAADDVRGLGAVLYTLLTSRWPLSGADAARAGLAAADRTAAGPVPPSALRPGVPVELDTLTRGTLGPEDGPGQVHTAAAVHRLLGEVLAEDDRLALFPPAHDGVPSAPGDVWQDRGRAVAPRDPRRRRKLALGVVALLVAATAVVGYIGAQLGSAFSQGTDGPAIVVDGPPVGPSDTPPDAAPGGVGPVAAVAGVEIFDNTGDRDNAGRVSRVIDGNADSGWRTFVYKQPFPALKPGVGIMVSFASAVQLAELTIDSPSAGTVVQVRSAPSAESAFDDTVTITEATVGGPTTPVSLAGSQPVTHVLLWITKLGGGGTENVTEINELQFRRAGA